MPHPFPTQERSLFVIEQQGKRSHLTYLLRQAGFTDFEVQPTFGALFDLPQEAIAINPVSLLVTGYEVKSKSVVVRLQELARNAARLYVMTDADREGELIAAQVRHLCPGKPIIRVRLRALTHEALVDGLQNAGHIDVGAATASAARRIVDRIIGYGFSTRGLPGRVGIVGRVLTAALSAFDRNPVACGEWNGRLAVGLEARGVITNRTIDEARRIEVFLRHAGHELERLPRERIRKLVAPPRPCNCADAILEGRRRLDIPTRTGERLLQARYQEGQLSYIRSDSTHLGPESRAIGMRLARAAKLTIARDAEQLYQRPAARGRRNAHEALHTTRPIDIELDPTTQDKSDALLALIARRHAMSLAAPVEIYREQVVPGELREFIANRLGENASQVDFQLVRDISAPAGWMRWLKRGEKPTIPQIELYGADATALSFLAGSNFGRPSNQIRFVNSLIDYGFIDEIGNVTPLGKKALDYAREHAPFLLDYSRIDAVEELLDGNESTSIPGLVNKLCEVMGIPVELAQTAVNSWYVSRRAPTLEFPDRPEFRPTVGLLPST